MSRPSWKIAAINFDHMHMGALLDLCARHPRVEIAALCDPHPERMQEAAIKHGIGFDRLFTEVPACMEAVRPDMAILCPATGKHAAYVEQVAPYGAHLFVEKPFAASLADADRMVAALQPGQKMVINWPLRWYPTHTTAFRMVQEGRIGEVVEVHHYGGNRGPFRHSPETLAFDPATRPRTDTWFYQKDEAGGSLNDYLGYGVTLGAWFNGGKVPLEVTAVTGGDPALEVDEHSVTICRYASGHLSKYETRWGTFTDPWRCAPQPNCGFVLVGTDGTIASPDYADSLRVQSREHPEGETVPVTVPGFPERDPVEYFINCLETGTEPEGPLSPAISRIGQIIVDAAQRSAAEQRSVRVEEVAK